MCCLRIRRIAVIGAALSVLVVAGQASLASAEVPSAKPLAVNSETSVRKSKVVDIERISEQKVILTVYSEAMGREIPVEVLLPKDLTKRHPVLYLLNGAGGGEDSATWSERTDVEAFFADEEVFVVTPVGGAFSYYTDWINDDPVIGRHKWATFLTQELPPLMDDGLGTTGKNAIAGISMSGTSVLNLAIAAPGLYSAVGSFSGCASTSSDLGQRYIRMVVEDRGGADATNMWGPYSGGGWEENDPYLNAEELRGTALYISTGTGLPGGQDKINGHEIDGNVFKLLNQVVVGGLIEAATYQCTVDMVDKLEALAIPVIAEFREGGTHSWGYWEQDLHDSWPVLAAAISPGLAHPAAKPTQTPDASPGGAPAVADEVPAPTVAEDEKQTVPRTPGAVQASTTSAQAANDTVRSESNGPA